MAIKKTVAPAKVNLTLHVTGQRADGYHLLDSLVVFTDAGDLITATPADGLTLTVTGPFSAGVPTDGTNLILRAAETLRRMRGVIKGAAITVEKHLPNEAGLGGGSSDAAATLKLLADMWDVEPLPMSAPEIVMLGADVPVCLAAPKPIRMQGIGQDLTPAPHLPSCAMVLINPKIAVPTKAVFDGLASKQNPSMADIPDKMDFDTFTDWLARQRNDLQPAAIKAAPVIQSALDRLNKIPQVAFAGMSGSGATCFGITKNMADARHAARIIQVAEMGWWVTPAQILSA
ncbi:4-(cytidine 5'-diphospho)-2-C-methyl-D-erythritol kinase [Loktanella sp. F6476L]|uniref:4-(cytidine 5'-diphospho)-2-C-methyl-D-erythritol kinase n=1 Tax=Loktanella sp. F6476L TaxID=2926405 RepID=UPI001FF2A3CF|nr:4-(cytidine 5'-diphospho)-2-C-methyl-D-erythritol kinase [Loktanella sp. F6476L]MCK0121357.1 4-(cytidine 5'-diphospho)-2-C-methyl-D-erythritol kinase [Loktanella sp. F6476L]